MHSQVWARPMRPEWSVAVVRGDAADREVSRAGGLEEAHTDDAALVRACAEGRAEAFDRLVERHRRSVYQLCYRFVGNHEDASDLSQDVFVRVYRGLGRFRGDASFSTWLYRIGVNVCLTRVTARTPATEPLEAESRVDRQAPDPAAGIARAQRARQVRAAIASLPARQRTVLILRVYQDLPHREIAALLGTSVGSVKANFFHALANLKKRLDGLDL